MLHFGRKERINPRRWVQMAVRSELSQSCDFINVKEWDCIYWVVGLRRRGAEQSRAGGGVAIGTGRYCVCGEKHWGSLFERWVGEGLCGIMCAVMWFLKCGVSGRALELQGIIIADLASLVETGNLFGMETLPTGICRVTLEMVAAGYILFV